mmetsp:Transcript_31616/g.57501  ORF Transcript_31616/g.57501 Transcript_31616/m.57501 type:complete len:202 (+) Transcript_31616:1112-1717(+)
MRCSTSTPAAYRTSTASIPSTLAKVSWKRSKAAKRTGITLSIMKWLRSWQLSRQQRVRSRSFSPFPSTPVEPGGATAPCTSSPLRTCMMAFMACDRLSHFVDCSEEAIICPNASDTPARVCSRVASKFKLSSSYSDGDGVRVLGSSKVTRLFDGLDAFGLELFSLVRDGDAPSSGALLGGGGFTGEPGIGPSGMGTLSCPS